MKKYDNLIDEAIEVCKKSKDLIITLSDLRTQFNIGGKRASKIMYQLEEFGIVKVTLITPMEFGNLLMGEIDKDKIRELRMN
ncbi:hypothetical protein C4577_04510 [Candidatus Parcubacteria bacterium]|nr:MAG: hypothetical protein C4577_04510 [Candidatus Parcubacteria bacterium]